ncbi:RNA methyltransferase [Larsenimonas rhizosphaerae]|uniref:tRNA (cytidine/uridine-2'-O-)-methyltransferase TrmJ n=1 Tax=Larsenimonas rhizosphaerae TaxID=2944682 RepID=A0AA42CTT8_9GAMM|nr:RNA methyltransferase [Larsenimonas rhizosphaerae]MCM2130904.1 RNA methyltransferase [Larsenimonas rhizosphaerae]MCX2523609.1 RNA methyltransferase [Larsenimonas rhizosphaerae]
MLSNIQIVLVQTFHPGNIGAAARAMKTMGLSRLILVAPRRFPDDEATAMAAGATDVLENARVVDTLDEAVGECVSVIGASARLRNMPLPHFCEPDEMAEHVMTQAASAPVALVFGRERFGLTNEEIQCCTHQMTLPAAPDYPILNLAQAVQVCAHELFTVWRKNPENQYSAPAPVQSTRPTQQQLQAFLQHLDHTLEDAGFHNQPHSRTLERLHAFYIRAQPSKKELSLLRGMLSAFSTPRDNGPSNK